MVGESYLDSNHSQPVAMETPAKAVPPLEGASTPAVAGPSPSATRGVSREVSRMLGQATQALEHNQLDTALKEVNAALAIDPQNADGYGLRSAIYAERNELGQARQDYEKAVQLDGKNNLLKYDLAEVEFRQKEYDAARVGFVALKQDPNVGDLASYKVFLCDLFGGHEDIAAKELDAFNQVEGNCSYYFANASWCLYHHQTEEGRGWLMSAANIYAPPKFRHYIGSLMDLGYVPLPPPPQQ